MRGEKEKKKKREREEKEEEKKGKEIRRAIKKKKFCEGCSSGRANRARIERNNMSKRCDGHGTSFEKEREKKKKKVTDDGRGREHEQII